jgi:hypothetical protein
MDDMNGGALHVARRIERLTLDLVERNLRRHISLIERLLAQQRELVSQLDGLGIDTSQFRTRWEKLEKEHRQRVVSPKSEQITFQENETRLGQAVFAGRGNAELTSSGNGPQEPLTPGSSEHAVAPILNIPSSAPLLQGEAAMRPRSLAESNAKAAEARATLKVLPSGQAREKGRAPLVTEQGLRLNRAFHKIGSALFREAVTALAEELAKTKTVEADPKERLGLMMSFARIEDATLRRALIELTEAIVGVKSRC